MNDTTHEAHLRRIVVHDPKWYPTGENLPAVQTGEGSRRSLATLPQKAPVRLPYTPLPQSPTQQPKPPAIADFAPLVNRWLVDCIGDTMRHVEPLDGYGRIILTKFIPTQACDPIMPVPLVLFSGIGGFFHNTAYRGLANLLIDLEDPGAWNTRLFVKLAKRYARRIVRYSRAFMKPDEHRYYTHQIWECVSNPHRADWKQIAAKQYRSE